MTHCTHESFLNDVKDHVLTINYENGVFRDLTFAKPFSSDRHINITTRSGYLYYSGDMGAFTFQRCHDMFGFFRSKDNKIQPYYWHEKLEADDPREGSEEYCEDLVKKEIISELSSFLEDIDLENEDEKEQAEQAKNAVDEFLGNISSEFELMKAWEDWDSKEAGGMGLEDFFEGRFKEYTSRYIWCLRAIVHVINLYDAGFTGERRNAITYFRKNGYRDSKVLVKDSKAWGSCVYYDTISQGFYGDAGSARFKIKDLESLLESWDFIEMVGTLAEAKRLYEIMEDIVVVEIHGKEYLTVDLGKAVRDVELIRGDKS